MILNAHFAECVQAVERFWILVDLQADLANEELILDLLDEFTPRPRHPAER